MKILKAMLKNARKYTYVTIAKGINLGNYKSAIRNKNKHSDGCSMRKYAARWFLLPEGKCIFKDYSGHPDYLPIKRIRILNEVLCYKLSKQIGLDCAKYEAATYLGNQGTISYNVVNGGEIILSANALFSQIDHEYEYSLESFAELLDKIMEGGTALDKEQVLFNLFKQMVFDTITFQTDRHENNIHFILNTKENILRVSPLIDNEFAFCGKLISKLIYYGRVKLEKENSKKDEEEFINQYCLVSQMFLATNFSDKLFNKNVEAIGYLCYKNEKYREEVEKYIKNLNIKKAFKELKEEGYKIPKSYEKYVKAVTDLSKGKLKQALKVKYSKDYSDDFLDEILDK